MFMGIGVPNMPNLGESFYQEGKRKEDLINQNRLNRQDDYDRILNQPGFISNAFNSAIQNVGEGLSALPQSMAYSVQQDPRMQQSFSNNTPQSPEPVSPVQNQPVQPQQSWTDFALDKTKPVAKELGAKTAALGNKVSESINKSLSSEDPLEFSAGIEAFAHFDDRELDPSTPAGQFKQQADSKYLKSVDEDGNKIYECPLTKKPCGRKTFWTRLKEFFLNLIGVQDQETSQANVIKLDTQDPITKKYTPKVQELDNPWASTASPAYKSKGVM